MARCDVDYQVADKNNVCLGALEYIGYEAPEVSPRMLSRRVRDALSLGLLKPPSNINAGLSFKMNPVS